MKTQVASSSGCNRRILKAFYTQYVAVLLIVLVFTIGSFQRASSRGTPIAPQAPIVSPAIGNFSVQHVFNERGEVPAEHARLRALVEVLKAHDLRAAIVIPSVLDFSGADRSSTRASMRAIEALEAFFRAQSLPTHTVRFVVRPALSHEKDSLHIYFEEVPDESRLL